MSRSDFERAMDIYSAIASGGDKEFLQFFVIPGPPFSKARPRFGRNGRVYTPEEQRRAEERTAAFMREEIDAPHTGNVALGCVFFRPNRQRIDTDNMLKHVCDAANGVLWNDDSQVTAIAGFTEYDPENPRTLVVIGRHESSMLRGTDAVRACAVCGTEFSILIGNPKKRVCSSRCRTELMGYTPLDSQIACERCGELFNRGNGYQRLCSAECRAASFSGKRKARGRPKSICPDCGKTLTHTRGGRCRDCWRSTVAVGEKPGATIRIAEVAT